MKKAKLNTLDSLACAEYLTETVATVYDWMSLTEENKKFYRDKVMFKLHPSQLPRQVQNKKTRDIYVVLRTVVNATNAQDGQVMVEYYIGGEYFVREINEFLDKFIFLKD